jgi:hypothetical protein
MLIKAVPPKAGPLNLNSQGYTTYDHLPVPAATGYISQPLLKGWVTSVISGSASTDQSVRRCR